MSNVSNVSDKPIGPLTNYPFLNLTTRQFLDLNPCHDGNNFAKYHDYNLPRMWLLCTRPEYMIWLLHATQVLDRKRCEQLAYNATIRNLHNIGRFYPGTQGELVALNAMLDLAWQLDYKLVDTKNDLLTAHISLLEPHFKKVLSGYDGNATYNNGVDVIDSISEQPATSNQLTGVRYIFRAVYRTVELYRFEYNNGGPTSYGGQHEDGSSNLMSYGNSVCLRSDITDTLIYNQRAVYELLCSATTKGSIAEANYATEEETRWQCECIRRLFTPTLIIDLASCVPVSNNSSDIGQHDEESE